MITIEKMDIEEEDPTDSPLCNERKSFVILLWIAKLM